MQVSIWRRVLYSAWARPILLIALLIVLWQLAIWIFRIPPYLIPAPFDVVKQLVNEWPKLWRETLVTTYATLGGFGLSILFGIPMALMIAYSRTVESFVYPLLVFSQSVPKVTIAPLFVVRFGFGVIPKVIAAFLLGLFPVAGLWAILPGQWRVLVNFGKVFVSVKLWPVCWAALTAFNARRSVHEVFEPAERGSGGVYFAVAAMYLLTPAISFLIVHLATTAAAMPFAPAPPASGSPVGPAINVAVRTLR